MKYSILILLAIFVITPLLLTNSDNSETRTKIHPQTHVNSNTFHSINKISSIYSNLQLSNVYSLTKGSGELIADIDTGIDPMFESNVFHNPNESIDGVDNDHNGFIDDTRGWNFVDNTNNTYDDSITWHGTDVASVILSMAPEAKILPIKYIGSDNKIQS